MSKNINQVFIANPITSNAATDLMYFGQSPYGIGNDAAMTYANFSAQFVLSTAIINPAHGGTGINNGTSTITIAGNFTMSGAFTFAGTLTNNTTVTFPTSGTLATVSQLTSPAQLIYISNDGNDTTGNGTIEFPYATYEKARSVVAPLATASHVYVIQPIGLFNITGDMTLSPFVNIEGTNTEIAQFNLTGSLKLDATFDTATNPFVHLGSIGISAGSDINLTFTVYKNAGVHFDDVDFTGTTNFNAVGSGTTANAELILIENCISVVNTSSFNFTNVEGVIINSTAGQPITSINSSATTANSLIINNTEGGVGNVTVRTTSTGTQTVIIFSSPGGGNSLTIDGTLNTVFIDSTSYTATPTYLNGATSAQIGLLSLSDGVLANTNFTPLNYTPTAGTNFLANSVTGNLNGIDTKIASFFTFKWNNVSGTTQAAAVNNGYIISNAGQTTVTLPATAVEGSVVSIQGKGAAGWILAANTGQTIHYGNSASTSSGSLTSTNQWDAVSVVCVTANTTWAVSYSIGSLTVA